MLNQSDKQTEDGHAMMTSDTFHSYRNLRHAVRGFQSSVLLLKVDQKGRHMTTVDLMRTHITTHVHVSPKTGKKVGYGLQICRGKLQVTKLGKGSP